MRADPIGLYVHIPFCKSKCNYCDFCSFPEKDVTEREEYIKALCHEIDSYKDADISVDTIFFGGGTPSLLTADEFTMIVSSIKNSFSISKNVEFTIEANPKTLTPKKLSDFVSHGVNRISLGLQSIHENEMKILGRIHSFDDFLDSYKMVKASGISDINVDLMYGIPAQTKGSLWHTLRTVAGLNPTHISLYGLILEEDTPLYLRKNELVFPSEDDECDMYYLARDILSEYGYHHYEISNYARRGYECKHNLKYWRANEYIGVGISAYSYFDGRRFGNTKNMDEYLRGSGTKYDCEEIDSCTSAYEYAMLGLRLCDGFSLTDYQKRFGVDFLSGREDKINELIALGYLMVKGENIALTERGLYVSNTVLTQLL